MKDVTEGVETMDRFPTREAAVEAAQKFLGQDEWWLGEKVNYVIVSTSDGQFAPLIIPASFSIVDEVDMLKRI